MLRSPISVHQAFYEERQPDTSAIQNGPSHWNQGVVILKVGELGVFFALGGFFLVFTVARVALDVAGDEEHENQR